MDAYPLSTSRRPIQFTISFLLAVTTLCGGLTCIGRLATLRYTGTGATAEEANIAFGHTACVLHIPEVAQDVDYYTHFQTGRSAFDISEADFLEWSKHYPWELKKYTLNDTIPISLQLDGYEREWPTDVRIIWHYSSMSHRGGWSVMFDRDRNRAYVAFSPR